MSFAPIGAVAPFVVVSRPAPPAASQQDWTALPSLCRVDQGSSRSPWQTRFYSEHTPTFRRLNHAGDTLRTGYHSGSPESLPSYPYASQQKSRGSGDVTLQAHGRTCAGQGAAVPHGIAAMFFSEANAEALRYPSTMGVLPSGRSLSGPTRHSRHRLFCYLPISPCGRAFFSLSFSRLRDLPAVPDGVDRRRLLSPACRLPSSAQVGRSARDRTPWVDLQVFASPTPHTATLRGAKSNHRRACPCRPRSWTSIGSNAEIRHQAGKPSVLLQQAYRRAWTSYSRSIQLYCKMRDC
jgi:hypothetical protein